MPYRHASRAGTGTATKTAALKKSMKNVKKGSLAKLVMIGKWESGTYFGPYCSGPYRQTLWQLYLYNLYRIRISPLAATRSYDENLWDSKVSIEIENLLKNHLPRVHWSFTISEIHTSTINQYHRIIIYILFQNQSPRMWRFENRGFLLSMAHIKLKFRIECAICGMNFRSFVARDHNLNVLIL